MSVGEIMKKIDVKFGDAAKSNYHHTRGITPKRVTSGGSISAA